MSKRVIPTAILSLGFVFTIVDPAWAQGMPPSETVEFAALIPAALILLFPIGTILLISSALPEEKAPQVAITLLVTWGLAAVGYFAVGFAFQFGGIAQVTANPDFSGLFWEWYPFDQSVDVEVARLWGIVALQGWFLAGETPTPTVLNLFLCHVSLVGVAAMLPASVLLQRERVTAAMVTAFFVGALVYPLPGNWLWGGGWLSHLGTSLSFGHGFIDFGGASVMFLLGAAMALVALLVFRTPPDEASDHLPRKIASIPAPAYRQKQSGGGASTLLEAAPMPSAYLPILSMLGGGIMLLGWFGITSGVHAPTAVSFIPGQAAVAGLLSALAGALSAAGYSAFTTREFNPLMTARGLMAGLIVAIAGAPFAPIWVLVVFGLIVGLLVPLVIYTFDRRLPLADHLGVLATFGISAVVSLLLVGFFADGTAGQGWNGVGTAEYRGVADQGVSGLVVAQGFAADWPSQLTAQLLGGGVIFLWALLAAFVIFQTVLAAARLRWRSDQQVTDIVTSEERPDLGAPEELSADAPSTGSGPNQETSYR